MLDPRSSTILDIFCALDFGEATEATTLIKLDLLHIHGGFDPAGGYTGYDYDEQAWIVEPT